MSRIQKWGNSLVVRIPEALARELDIEEGTPIVIGVRARTLILRPARRPRYRLADLLARCRKETLHGETDWGSDLGREILE